MGAARTRRLWVVTTLVVDQWGCPGLDSGAASACLALYGLCSPAKINSVSSVSLASTAQAYDLFFGILRHPTALAPKGIAHGIPRARSSACGILEIPAYSVLQLCSLPRRRGPRRRRRDNDARRPAHAGRGPLAPALHFCNTAPALPAGCDALFAPVRAPPARSRRRHPWFTLPVTCAAVADELGRPDGPGRLARGKRHGRPNSKTRREIPEKRRRD